MLPCRRLRSTAARNRLPELAREVRQLRKKIDNEG